MNANSPSIAPAQPMHFEDLILEQGDLISKKLHLLSMQQFPPNAKKLLRQFSLSEVAQFLGVSQSTLKKLHLEGKGPLPQTSSSGRRSYSAEQMAELRQYLDQHGRSEARNYVPYRRPGEKLQVIAVVNFKGGSGKTTTAAHLAQYMALTGHRVLAVDLDPQASLSSLHGFQPELDMSPSLYEALRYDDQRRSISEIIQPTNFPASISCLRILNSRSTNTTRRLRCRIRAQTTARPSSRGFRARWGRSTTGTMSSSSTALPNSAISRSPR